MSPGPPRVCQTQSPRKPALFCTVQGCLYNHLSAPGITLEKISVSRGEAQPFGEFTQLSARVTLYDNSVYGNWLHQKGIAKVSGILEGSDFNIRSIWKVDKRTQRERLKNKMRRKYLSFFIYSYSLKKGKREGQCIQSSLKDAKKSVFLRDTIF